MDAFAFLRTIGALGLVLGLLGGALWLVKRYDLTMPQKWLARIGDPGRQRQRRLELVERLAIDPRRSLVLVRRDDREFSLLIAPEGVLVLDPALGNAAPLAPETTDNV